MTETKKAVWAMLRSRQNPGHRFRRQVPLGPYIADFACHGARLIIEIDGGQHDPSSPEEAERSRFLANEGYRVLRFWNNDVRANPEGVWLTISAALVEHHPHPTLPHRGGGPSDGRTAERAICEWHRFGDLSAVLLYEVLAFRQAIFVVEQRCAYPDLDGSDHDAQHLLLRTDGALAGYLRLIEFPAEQRVAIGRVAVAAMRRRHGLARLLMEEALARCARDYPDCTVTLTAQTYLQSFYESLGFHPTSPEFDDWGLRHIEMALSSRESKKAPRELLETLEPIEEEFPEIDDPPPEDVHL